MGKPLPIFNTSTETVVDITNAAIHSNEPHRPHLLELLASKLEETLDNTALAETPDNTSLAETLDTNYNASPSTPLVETLEPSTDTATTRAYP